MTGAEKRLEEIESYFHMDDLAIARTKEGRKFWRRQSNLAMHSGLPEYCPKTEFIILLDYIDELEEKPAVTTNLAYKLIDHDNDKTCPFCSKDEWGEEKHVDDCPFAIAYAIQKEERGS